MRPISVSSTSAESGATPFCVSSIASAASTAAAGAQGAVIRRLVPPKRGGNQAERGGAEDAGERALRGVARRRAAKRS